MGKTLEMVKRVAAEVGGTVEEETIMPDGYGVTIAFPNGRAASVIDHAGSYGLEMAVLTRDRRHVDSTTRVTADDPQGTLTFLDSEGLRVGLIAVRVTL